MVDILRGQSKQFTVTFTDPDGDNIDVTSITAGAIAVGNGSKTLPVSLVSTTPNTDAPSIDAVFEVDVTELGKNYTVSLLPTRVADSEGATNAAVSLQESIRAYDTMTFQMGPTGDRFQSYFETESPGSDWVFEDDNNSLGVAYDADSSGNNLTWPTQAVRAFGTKYFKSPTKIHINGASKVNVSFADWQKCTTLFELKANSSSVDLTGFDMADLDTLVYLAVSYTPTILTDTQVAALPNLTSLELAGNTSTITDAAFPTPANLDLLNFRDSPNIALTPTTLAAGAWSYLDFQNCSGTTINDACLNQMTGATRVNFNGCSGSASGSAIANLTADFIGMAGITLTGVDDTTLAGIPQVTDLWFNDCPNGAAITATGVANLTAIEDLGIANIGLDAATLDAILTQLAATSPSLSKVVIRGNPGTATINKGAGSGYESLINAGVTIEE